MSLHHQVDISRLTKGFDLEFPLEQMSQVLKTNHIPIIEPGDFAADAFTGPLPVDTPCPGTHPWSFACYLANFQAVTPAGSARGSFGIM